MDRVVRRSADTLIKAAAMEDKMGSTSVPSGAGSSSHTTAEAMKQAPESSEPSHDDDPETLKWREFSIAYENTDPAMSTLAEYFANGTDTADITSVPTYCEDIVHQLRDSELDYSWNRVLPCVTYTNITRKIHDEHYPKNLTESLAAYNVNGTLGSLLLGDHIARVIGKAMHLNCKMLRCGIEREDKWGLEEFEHEKEAAEEQEEHQMNGEHLIPDKTMSMACQTLFLNGDTLSFEATNQCQSDICIRARDLLTADPEIGGPGVFISYAMQLLIAIVFMIYFFVKYITNCFRRRRRRHRPSQADLFIGVRNAHPASTNALESFQKLQAWFSASLVVAACIRHATQQVSDTDHYLLLCVALNGVVLIPLTLLILHRLGRRAGWGTFYLSATAFIMCAGFLWVGVRERHDSLYSLASLFHHSQWCGRESFFAVALPHFWAIREFLGLVDAVPDAAFWCTLTICTLVLLALFTMRLEVHRMAMEKYPWLEYLETPLKVAVTLSYTAILVMTMILLVPFVAVVNWANWGFGQIVALSVFMPILYDYLSERLKKRIDEELTSPKAGGSRKMSMALFAHHIHHPHHHPHPRPLRMLEDDPNVEVTKITEWAPEKI